MWVGSIKSMFIKRSVSLALATLALTGGMATASRAEVIVDKVHCFEETDEWGSDALYTVTFRGNTSGDFNNNVGVKGPGSYWNDFDSGESVDTDVVQSSSNPSAVANKPTAMAASQAYCLHSPA